MGDREPGSAAAAERDEDGHAAEELRALRNTIVDGLIIIDAARRVLSFNPAAEAIFGYRAGEVIGRNVNMLMPEPYHAEHDTYVDRYLETGHAKIIGIGREVVGRRKDGTTFPMYLSVGEMELAGARRFVGVVQDITARRQAEELLSGITENLPGPVFRRVRHPDGRVSFPFVSSGLARIFALDPESVKTDPDALIQAIHPDDRAGWREALAASARDLNGYDYQMRVAGADGVERWMHAIARPVRRDDGAIVWDGLALDISERQSVQDQLHQAQKMEAIGQLTGGIAHDFNNLLAVLMMDLEILDGPVQADDERSELIAEAREATRAAAGLTQQLLAFARRQPLEPKTIDPAALLSVAASLIRRTIGGAIRIDLVQPNDLWKITADPTQLETAILNLAINARDAMPDGGTLAISSENAILRDVADVAPGEYVRIEVSDTGSGMSPEVINRAFEPFFTTKATGLGTGMGLSMVFGFVKQSEGHIEIASAPDEGTTLSLYFPRASAHDDWPEAVGPRAPEGRRCARILYVEDHPSLRRRTATILKDLGYRVEEAGQARPALARLESAGRFDVLFTDVVMPGGMDGVELARRARSMQPALRVLFTSGYADDARLRGDSLENWAMLLRKPFSPKALSDHLRKLLDR